MENRTVIGLDIAKNIFQLHIADGTGKRIRSIRVRRDQLLEVFATLPPALVGMEACGSAHHWARKLQELGHEVKMMAPQHVKPYVQGNKTDSRDAAAICEAASRPGVPSVKIKSVDQQQMQSLHKMRELLMKQRVATVNQIRGLLAEVGVVVAKSPEKLKKALPHLLASEEVPGILRTLIETLFGHLKYLEEQLSLTESQIKRHHKENRASRLIEGIPGVGVLTATAVIASVGNASHFGSSRQFASSFGLTPREHSSGESRKQFGISKRGNVYLRKLLIQGARTIIVSRMRHSKEKTGDWLDRLVERRGFNVAAVALAAKNTRRIWAMLQTGEVFDPNRDEMLRMPKAV
jgi:transposase